MYLYHLLIIGIVLFINCLFYLTTIMDKKSILINSIISIIVIILNILLPLGTTISIGGISIILSLFIYPSILIIGLSIVLHKNIVHKFAQPFILVLLIIISEILCIVFFSEICDVSLNELNDYKSIYYFSDYKMLLFFLLTIVLFSFYFTISYYKKDQTLFQQFSLIICIGLIILILSSIIVYFIIDYIFSNENAFLSYAIGFIVIIIFSLLTMVLLFKLIQKIIKMNKEIEDLKLEQITDIYHKIVNTSFDEIMKMHHDMGNMIEILKTYQVEAAEKLSERFRQIPKTTYSVNQILNQILVIKIKEAQDANISVDYKINYPKNDIIEMTDLISLLTNLFDNAIEACTNAINRNISFSIHNENDEVFIHFQNTFLKDNKLRSNRYIKKKYHGYGKRIIKDITHKYNGAYEECLLEDTYIVDITLKIN